MQIQAAAPVQAPRIRPVEEVIAPYRHLLGDAIKLNAGALKRLRAYAADHELGQPSSNPARWNGLTVQRYPKGPALVVDDGRETFQVRNGFYEFYTRPGAQQALGAPQEEEHWEGNRVVQRFAKAMLIWQPNKAVTIGPKR
ncbi:MAG: hypothetical protein JWM80_4159 [Cyanobacteria bacterium RYN_339]|nr:hypothetical protein [Cyanobacteria bacterium RYN_339]